MDPLEDGSSPIDTEMGPWRSFGIFFRYLWRMAWALLETGMGPHGGFREAPGDHCGLIETRVGPLGSGVDPETGMGPLELCVRALEDGLGPVKR